ncbi:MAG: hypothetical protein WC569_02370 [Candidatus Omnitrophota bacterium]
MKSGVKFILLVVGIFFTFFMLARDLVETKTALKKSQEQIAQEKIEMAQLKEELRDTREQFLKTDEQLRNVRVELVLLNRKIGFARKDNAELRKAKRELEQKICLLAQEKASIEARLHSIVELKKAIREAKAEIYEKKVKAQKQLDARELANGNRGFLFKDGKSLYQPKVKIEVKPAS